MTFDQVLISGKLLKRYKRFLADIELSDGKIITAHCPNSGSMKTCVGPDWPVLLSRSANPKRKYPFTWEMVHNGKCWIGINTGIPNRIAAEGIENGKIVELGGYQELQQEVKYGKNSRIDILLTQGDKKCYVEVKNVTLVEEDGSYCFPDSVTERGKKHLDELAEMHRQGQRAVMLFIVQRRDGRYFRPAGHIDPVYASRLKEVHKIGVEILVYRADISPTAIEIAEQLPWQFT